MSHAMNFDSEIEKLVEVLDVECEHLERVMDFMTSLGRGVLKRDDEALQKLLEEIRTSGDAHKAVQEEREAVRARLAAMLGWSREEVRLSEMEKHLEEPLAQAVRKRRVRLASLVEQLQKQHRCTAGIVAEMGRINRALLAAITGAAPATTYNHAGAARWSGTGNLLSIRY